jgi:hypothetical protein
VLHDKNNEINNITDNQLKWEKLKTIVKEFSIEYSQQKSYNTKQCLQQIEAEIEKLELIDSNLIDMKKKPQLYKQNEMKFIITLRKVHTCDLKANCLK